jgi:hypothetical protein
LEFPLLTQTKGRLDSIPRKKFKIREKFYKSFLRLFFDLRVYTREEVTLVVVWVGGGFITSGAATFKRNCQWTCLAFAEQSLTKVRAAGPHGSAAAI